jgi:hypothetical protein
MYGIINDKRVPWLSTADKMERRQVSFSFIFEVQSQDAANNLTIPYISIEAQFYSPEVRCISQFILSF